ncbi:MAG: DUF4157 domain-containing protein [Chitinophagaceae bacterium]
MPEHVSISQSQTVHTPATAEFAKQQSLTENLHSEKLDPLFIQCKLPIGAVDDPLEHEADAMADKVMRMPEQSFIQRQCDQCEKEEEIQQKPLTSFVQRKCAHCEEKEKILQKPLASFIQRKGSETGSFASESISNQIHSTKGKGSSIDEGTISFMQNRFGADFGDVKIHTDGQAIQMNRDLHARAFTVGNDIYFNQGQYQPGSESSKHLLAHELTHTIQQGGNNRSSSAIQRRDDGTVQKPKYDTPQEINTTRRVRLPDIHKGEDVIIPYVLRTIKECPCRQSDYTAKGVFWNPDANNFAIAFSYCTGQKRLDAYAKLQSNLLDVLRTGAKGVGTLRIGADIGIKGTQITLEGVGTNEGAGTPGTTGAIPEGTPGVGGRVKVLFEGQGGKKWAFFLDAEYVRRLGELPRGANPNEIKVGGGLKVDDDSNLQLNVNVGSTTEVILSWNTSWGEGATPKCYNCVCPPPQPNYECVDILLDRDEEVKSTIEQPVPEEFKVYFKYFKTDPSEDGDLRKESDRNIISIGKEVAEGAEIEMITGYTSPEGKEKEINQPLSERRANKTAELVRKQVGDKVTLPTPYGGGALLGSRPENNPGSQLSELITESGFKDAQMLAIFLNGEEIPDKELASQFIGLFKKLSEPVDKPHDKLALFGIQPDDPIASKVLATIDQFMKTGGKGYRPWERVFQLLRVGVVRLSKKIKKEVTDTVRHPGDVIKPDKETCNQRGQQAEIDPGFGAIVLPFKSEDQAEAECRNRPSAEEEKNGCKYTVEDANAVELKPPSMAAVPIK